MARLLRNFFVKQRFNHSKMGEASKNNRADQVRDDAPDVQDLLDALLRSREVPEPSPWFAARTLARLRNQRAEVGWGWARALFIPGTARRLAAGLCVFAVVVSVGLAGMRSQARQADQRLTFAALEMAAQGELPVTDEEAPPWLEGNY